MGLGPVLFASKVFWAGSLYATRLRALCNKRIKDMEGGHLLTLRLEPHLLHVMTFSFLLVLYVT